MLYWQRLTFGLKRLYQQPRLCLPVIISLGLTMAAILVVLTLCYNILLKPLPHIRQAEQLTVQQIDITFGSLRVSFIDKYRFVSLQRYFAEYGNWGYLQSSSGNRTQINESTFNTTRFYASSNTPLLLGIPLLNGNAAEQTEPENKVWISESLWQQRFNGNASAIGQSLTFENATYIISGVLPDFYAAPDNHHFNAEQIWHFFDPAMTPAHSQETSFGSKATIILRSNGHTPADAEIAQWLEAEKAHAPAALAPLFQTTEFKYDQQAYRQLLLGDSQKLLWLLLVVTAGLFSIACLNLTNVLLAHYQSRQHEFAVQTFTGCRRSKLYLLVALENLSLIVPAVLLGLLASQWLFRFLPTLAGEAIPMTQELSLSGFSLLVAILLTLLLLGLFSWPVVRVKASLAEQLSQSGKGNSKQNSPALIKSLLVLQLTIASALITGSAALAWHSYKAVYTNWGFSMNNSYQIQLRPEDMKPVATANSRDDYDQKNALFRQNTLQLRQALQQHWPQARVLTGGTQPISNTMRFGKIKADENASTSIDHTSVDIGEDYFDAYNIRLLHGRNFIADEEPQAVIIDLNFAKILQPANPAAAVGQYLYRPQAYQVIGIADNVKNSMSKELPMLYTPVVTSDTPVWQTLVIILPKRQLLSEAEAQQALGELATGLEITVLPMYKTWLKLTEQSRIYFYLICVISATTLLLALLGIAGVSQMRAQQRRYELAVRMATGASQQRLLWLLGRESGVLVVGGLMAGAILTTLGYQQLQRYFGVLPELSAWLLLSLNLLLLCVAMITLLLPGWQVIRHDPMKTLRAL